MKKNFARLLATVFPLVSACVDKVPLADKSDGGPRDVPPADVPVSLYTDVPPMDAPPPTMCAVCGGPTGIDCLYAPGCGSIVRVCAPNTCGDAVAIAHCGCDGQTFVSGCITPDRPFRYTGSCETGPDGGTDGGPTPVEDVLPLAPYCAENAYYPGAVVQRPPDAALSPWTFGVRGRWLAPRRLATPLAVDCPASVAGDPACHPDAVIRVQPDGDAGLPEEWLTSVAFESLPSVAVGTEVLLQLLAEAVPVGIPRSGNVTLIVQRASDNAVLMVVADTIRDATYNSGAPFPLVGDIGVQRSAAPACLSRAAPVGGLTGAVFGMEVLGVTGGRAVQPRETVVFGGASGRYSFHNLRFTHAVGSATPPDRSDASTTIPDGGRVDFYGFEIVRQPDL